MPNRNQKWFNKMVAGLSAQGWKRAFDSETGLCLYLAPDGCKCSVGQILPPDAPVLLKESNYEADFLYSSHQMDQLGLGAIEGANAATYLNTLNEVEFLIRAQTAHDCASTPADMQLSFRLLARRFNLVQVETELRSSISKE